MTLSLLREFDIKFSIFSVPSHKGLMLFLCYTRFLKGMPYGKTTVIDHVKVIGGKVDQSSADKLVKLVGE
ncbi:hypothetical protein FZC78_07560 [Rossellomorea vietnamensis]|uniref:Uncharacterized protein n=1 Tax=Rossellomorea vietnamensis TaxID=218284 RepID=A0A5D4NV16_9BACI|nr:hypothetical protein [Rossellomorea vietnamensis]TYS17709.1 hypothetical protein FZC78_07560 [Rossellomorea vietnamensis]